jgi:hypothetical protein
MMPPDVGDGSMVSDATLTQVCNLAAMGITKATASGKLVPIIQGGHCQVDAQAQFQCESSCMASGMCEADITVRCDKANLSGQCSGECTGGATCEGSVMAMATCQGTCEATCTGTCSGNCVGKCGTNPNNTGPCATTCTGTCDASCKGSCSGDCKLDANAMVMCGASVSCRGGCSVQYTAPTCEGQLNPPSCNIDAECEAACNGQGTFQATCSPPQVLVTSTDMNLQNTIEKNYPVVLQVAAQVALVGDAVANISSTVNSVISEVNGSVGCEVVVGVDFATKLQASVAAAATFSVSVMASATVITSVGP